MSASKYTLQLNGKIIIPSVQYEQDLSGFTGCFQFLYYPVNPVLVFIILQG